VTSQQQIINTSRFVILAFPNGFKVVRHEKVFAPQPAVNIESNAW
jgi:hypothetical protein